MIFLFENQILPSNYELIHPTNFSRTSNADFGDINKIVTLCSYIESSFNQKLIAEILEVSC